MNTDVDRLQQESSETSRDLKGYLEPLIHLCTVLKIANESCIRSQEITLPSGSLFLLESLFSRFLKKFWQSSPMPPFVPNTSGVKVTISTSITLWLYFLFFSFSCSLKIVAVCLPWFDRELTCVTGTSKSVVTPVVSKTPLLSYLTSLLDL